MKKGNKAPYVINSISEQHRMLSLPKPQHPLVSVFDFRDIQQKSAILEGKIVLNFYCIAIKKGYTGKLKYGQNYYDFDEGVMSFISPGQLLSLSKEDENPPAGCCLVFHPDFISNYPLGRQIKSYGFFSYALNEALHLSDKEEAMVTAVMQNIKDEYQSTIDHYSQDVIISLIELLLNYSNRFYNRQFITRKDGSTNNLLINLERTLSEYFDSDKVQALGLPTVQYVSSQLNVSPHYLSDMLRSLTGQNTQGHIHNKVIERAKEILTTTSLPVSEIAYQLGFEHPQSFHKLFKSKTNYSPLAFRTSFN